MNRKHCPKAFPPQLQLPSLSPEEEQELDYYVCCCIEDIQNTLLKNPTEKQKKLADVSLRILKNPAESAIKKKQVMRQWCGDYKKKFDSEKKKVIANLNDCKIAFGQSGASQKSMCIKKHVLKSNDNENCNNVENNGVSKKQTLEFTGSNSFRFDFESQSNG